MRAHRFAAALGLLVGSLSLPSAAATAITVDTAADGFQADGHCGLREAIRAANLDAPITGCPAGNGTDAITLPPGTYGLTAEGDGDEVALTGDLDITSEVTLVGAGAGVTVIDGAWPVDPDRILDLHGSANLTVSGVTIRDGNESAAGAAGIFARDASTLTMSGSVVTSNVGRSFAGIAVADAAVANLTDVIIMDNVATDVMSTGVGALGSAGITNLTNVTVSGNTSAANVGGLFVLNLGMLRMTNVTVSGNSAAKHVGGVAAAGDATAILNGVTVAGNIANSDNSGADVGGGIYREADGILRIRNSIVSGNAVGIGGSGPDCYGMVVVEGPNLIADPTDCTGATGPGQINGQDPELGALTDNGGFTPTHALLQGSPAIGAGGADCAATDQRGVPRAECDLGAYELVTCFARPVDLTGTAGNDLLRGTGGRDIAASFGGRDRLSGLGGADRLCAGRGQDVVKGGGGSDRLGGEQGRDLCVGGAGRDRKRGCERQKTIP